MWQRFSERARRAIFYAQEEAGRLGGNYVSTEHLLLGLVRDEDNVAARILDRLGVSLLRIRAEIERRVEQGDSRLSQDMQLTPRAKRVIDLAYNEAQQLNNNYIGTEHLLLGLIREEEGMAGQVLHALGADLEQARQEVRRLQEAEPAAGAADEARGTGKESGKASPEPEKKAGTSMWNRFTERARRVIFFAQEEAGRLGERYVSTEHLLLGLIREDDTVAAQILDRVGLRRERIRREIERQVVRGESRLTQDMQLTPRAKKVIELAYDESQQLSNSYIGTEHLLLGLIREGNGLAGRVLSELGANLKSMRQIVRRVQNASSPPSPKIGSLGDLRSPAGRGAVEVPVDGAAVLEFAAVNAARDETGYREMQEKGRFLLVPTGVRIEVLPHPKDEHVKDVLDRLYIQILDGEFVGRSGWITESEFVYSGDDKQIAGIWQQFTGIARLAMVFARVEATRLGEEDVSPECILLGLLQSNGTAIAKILRKMEITQEQIQAIRADIEQHLGHTSTAGETAIGFTLQGDVKLTPRAEHVVDLAQEEAKEFDRDQIDAEHLLLGLLRDEEGIAGSLFRKQGVDLERARQQIRDLAEQPPTPSAPSADFSRTEPEREGKFTPLWQRFTENARHVIFFAQEESARLGENYVSTEHLLLGLVRQNDTGAARLLDQIGVSLGRIRSEIERNVARGDGRLSQEMQLTPRGKRVIDLAFDEARKLDREYIGTEHLLLGLIREGEGLAGRVLNKLGMKLEEARHLAGGLADIRRQDANVGASGVVRAEGGRSTVEFAIDNQALQELSAIYAAKDSIGYREICEQKRCLFMPSGIRVKRLQVPNEAKWQFTDLGIFYYVRVLDGEFAGRSGWIAANAFEATDEKGDTFPPEL